MHGINKVKQVFVISFVFFIQLFSLSSLCAEGFVGGTLVATPNGYVPIESLRKNDEIFSYNPVAKQIEPTRVVKTYNKKIKDLAYVIIDGTKIISHPSQKFYSPISLKRWTRAGDLYHSDQLILDLDTLRHVHSCEVKKVPKTRVYYLTLEKNHTFFVTERNILVHNFEILTLTLGAWIISVSIEVLVPIVGFCVANWMYRDHVLEVTRILEGSWDPCKTLWMPYAYFNGEGPNDNKNEHDWLNNKIPNFPEDPEDPKGPKKGGLLGIGAAGTKAAMSQQKKSGSVQVVPPAPAPQPIKQNAQDRLDAAALGFPIKSKNPPFNTRGMPAYTTKNHNKFISRDRESHKGGHWKVFDRQGTRDGTFNSDLSKKIGT